MSKTRVEISGVANVIKELEGVAGVVYTRTAIRNSAARVAEKILVPAVRREVPKVSGNLRRSIGVVKSKKSRESYGGGPGALVIARRGEFKGRHKHFVILGTSERKTKKGAYRGAAHDTTQFFDKGQMTAGAQALKAFEADLIKKLERFKKRRGFK